MASLSFRRGRSLCTLGPYLARLILQLYNDIRRMEDTLNPCIEVNRRCNYLKLFSSFASTLTRKNKQFLSSKRTHFVKNKHRRSEWGQTETFPNIVWFSILVIRHSKIITPRVEKRSVLCGRPNWKENQVCVSKVLPRSFLSATWQQCLLSLRLSNEYLTLKKQE